MPTPITPFPFIHTIRGVKVILDSDLAHLYGVPTKRLLEQMRRNAGRFPEDFAFRLRHPEYAVLRSQIATLKTGRGQHRKYLPLVFTEHGALQAANIINSPQAAQMSIYVVQASTRSPPHHQPGVVAAAGRWMLGLSACWSRWLPRGPSRESPGRGGTPV